MKVVNNWFRANRVLISRVKCPCKLKVDDNRTVECDGPMSFVKRTGKTGNTAFRCNKSRTPERETRMFSFEKSNVTIPDIMLFIKRFLDKLTLLQCSKFSGLCHKSTAVNWLSLFGNYSSLIVGIQSLVFVYGFSD